MKKIFGLFVFLALATETFASAEVFPSLDDDVGVELALLTDSVTLEMVSVDAVNDFGLDWNYSGSSDSILVNEFIISDLYYVSDTVELPDIWSRANLYNYKFTEAIYNPPLVLTFIYMSSYSLVDKQVSLRA